MISKETIKNRIARGMTPEQAEKLPLQWVKKLTIEKVLEMEANGLSITSSAFLLNVTAQTLHGFIKRNKIEWRGKGFNYKKGEVNPKSDYQKSKSLGVCNMTIQKRMERHGISFDEAVAMQKRKHTRLTVDMIKQAIEFRSAGKFWNEISKIISVDCGYLARKVREYQNGKTD